jgi:hypothetical protein
MVNAVGLLRLVPLIVTFVPTGPYAGLKEFILGVTIKFVLLVAVPPAVVIDITPVMEPGIGVVTNCVLVLELTPVVTPPMTIEVGLLRLVPVIVTVVYIGPEEGVNEVIVGAGITVKLVLLYAVPSEVVTDICPVVAPAITVPTNCVPELETTLAVTPPIVKAVGLLRLVPVIVTLVPIPPEEGVKEVIVGGPVTTKDDEEFAVPYPVNTWMVPVVVPTLIVIMI